MIARASRPGWRRRRRSRRRRRPGRSSAPLALIAGAACALLTRPVAAQRIDPDSASTLAGTVASAVTGVTLANARVMHVGSGYGAITDSVGAFRIPDLPPGPDTVEVSLIGFAQQAVPLELAPGATTRVVFLLSETVLQVAELYVEVERSRLRDAMSEFETRRGRGAGYFITPEMIEERNPDQPSDLLRPVPGLSVGPWEPGGASIRVVRANLDCLPTMYLNGVLWPGHHIDELDRNALLGIEIYRGPAEMPPRFQFGGRASCGAIIVWTRQGGPGG